VKSLRRIGLGALVGSLALLLVAAGSAGAAGPRQRNPIRPPAKVKVGRVTLGQTPTGEPALLIAVRYPIEASGRLMSASLSVTFPGAGLLGAVAGRVSSGALRRPERRHSFTFVHEISLGPKLGRQIAAARREGHEVAVRVDASGRIDIDQDGHPDISSQDSARRVLSSPGSVAARPSTKPFCASVPVVMPAPGANTTVPLPACTSKVSWKVASGPSEGSARIAGASLAIAAPKRPGAQTIKLNHGTVAVRVVKPWSSDAALGATTEGGPVVRAMGDSVTAGYGYYSDGKQMSIFEFPGCRPVGEVLDDACSSNSTNIKSGESEVHYAPDYGRANDVSWAAQWANQYGVTNYKNLAVTGSEPVEWAPGGKLYGTTKEIEAEDPDYILMTLGANPILAETLLGLEPMACAIVSDILGEYRKCVEEAFEGVNLRRELKRVYTDLVEKTQATIYVMQYHLAVPSSALAYTSTQIAEMAKLMNETIAEVAKEVSPTRLQVVTPPHFDVGVSLEPVYPAKYTCSYFEYPVDGPSVQSTLTQDELAILHPLSFCKGPASGGPPWIISGDTGIHPSATGYAQMESQVPPPAPTG
jgi:lysophospholipase L1-like esterase